jgi:hypothetical protein
MAGAALLGSGLGAAAAHYGQQALGAMTPAHSQEMTQFEHAANNLGGMREKYGISAQDLALYEGIRQGLMSGEITGAEVNQLAMQGALPENVLRLVTDIHDWSSAEPYPWPGQAISEALG